MKMALSGLTCRYDTDKEKFHELKDKTIKIIHTEKKENEQNSAVLIQM